MTEPRFALPPLSLDRDGLREAILAKLALRGRQGPGARHPPRLVSCRGPGSCATVWSTAGLSTTRGVYEADRKRVYYLSLEFLNRRLLGDAVWSTTGLAGPVRAALAALGVATPPRS